MRLPSSLMSYGYPVKRCGGRRRRSSRSRPSTDEPAPARSMVASRTSVKLGRANARVYSKKKAPSHHATGPCLARAEMAVGSARGTIIGAAHARVAERLARHTARRSSTADGSAALMQRNDAPQSDVPQALRRHRRGVGARAARAALSERAVARRRARRVALPGDADAALSPHAVSLLQRTTVAGAARVAAVGVAAAVGAGLVGEHMLIRVAHAATQWPTMQTSPLAQSLSTLHGGAGMPPFGLPAAGRRPVPVDPLPPVCRWPPRQCRQRRPFGFDGLSRVHAPAAAIKRLAATAPSRLLKIGRDIVLLRGAIPQASATANTSTMPPANSAESAAAIALVNIASQPPV